MGPLTLTDDSNLQKILGRFVFCPNPNRISVFAVLYPAIRLVSFHFKTHLKIILPAMRSSADTVTELGAQ